MSDPSKKPLRDRSLVLRLVRYPFTPRGARRVLIVLAWAASIIALLYGIENWRGRRALSQSRKQIESRGEPFVYKAVIPPPLPDDQNFAATPFIKDWFREGGSTNTDARWNDHYALVAGRAASPKVNTLSIGQGQFVDLVRWESALKTAQPNDSISIATFGTSEIDAAARAKAAQAVLEAIKDSDANLEQIRAASARPRSRYPMNYDVEEPFSLLLPHLANIRAACDRLQLRACAELACGRTDQALEDVNLMLYLGDTLKGEPTLVSLLVRFGCIHRAIQPIWEGLAQHAWSEQQVQALQSRFEQYDFLSELRFGFTAERAGGLSLIEYVRHRGFFRANVFETGYPGSVGKIGDGLIPDGWYCHEAANYCRLFALYLDGPLRSDTKIISPAETRAAATAVERELESRFGRVVHHKAFASMLLPALPKVNQRTAFAQTAVNNAAIACALERYHLVHGNYPDNLENLQPQFLKGIPSEIVNGKPLKYARDENDRFKLYSVGWNEVDDGGHVVLKQDGTLDLEKGDWVWR